MAHAPVIAPFVLLAAFPALRVSLRVICFQTVRVQQGNLCAHLECTCSPRPPPARTSNVSSAQTFHQDVCNVQQLLACFAKQDTPEPNARRARRGLRLRPFPPTATTATPTVVVRLHPHPASIPRPRSFVMSSASRLSHVFSPPLPPQ